MFKKIVAVIEALTLVSVVVFVGTLFVRKDDGQAVATDDCPAILASAAAASEATDDSDKSSDKKKSDDSDDSQASDDSSADSKGQKDNLVASDDTTTTQKKGKATTTTQKGKGTTTTTTAKPTVSPEDQKKIDDCLAQQNGGGGNGGGAGGIDAKALYQTNCASCHGADGGGGIGPALKNGAVTKKFKNAEDSLKIIADGDGGMPAFKGSLSPEELQAVNEYIRSL
jgi:cytochrome c551